MLIAYISETNALISIFNEWMNDSAFCHSSAAQCPIPYTPRERSRPDWEVKMVIEGGEESHRYSWQPHRCQKSMAAWLPRQGGREAFPIEGRGLWTSTFLPHSLLLLPIANGKAKASPGCRRGSATEESKAGGRLSYLVHAPTGLSPWRWQFLCLCKGRV